MEKLYEIVSRVLNIPLEKIDDSVSRDTTEEWDSFNHLLLISEIEKEMGVTFTIKEVGETRDVLALKAILQKQKPHDKSP